MPRSTGAVLTSLAAVWVLSACGDQDAELSTAPTHMPAVAVGSHLAFVETEAAEAVLLDVEEETKTRVARVALPPAPLAAEARRGDAEELLVLCSESDASAEESDASLAVVETGETPTVRRYALPAPFTAMRQSEDGRYVFLFFDDDVDSERVLFNPNQIAFIDLEAAPDTSNPRLRSLRSYGEAPNGVFFSPPFPIDGADRRLAVVHAETYVSIFDLEHPERAETTVPLTDLNDERAIDVAQVIFDTEQSWIYVRGASANDIFVLPLAAKSGEIEEGTNDFRISSINQLGVGRQPTDMKLFKAATDNTSEERLRLLAVAEERLAIIDPRSSRITDIPIDEGFNRALLFETREDPEEEPRRQALLYSEGSTARSVAFVDLKGIEERRSRNIETFSFDAPISRVLPRLEGNVVALVHGAAGSSAPALSLLDLEERTVSPIRSSFSLEPAILDPSGTRLWVAIEATREEERLAFLELQSFHTGQIRLDAPIHRVVPMDEATGRIAVLHGASEGYVTVVDVANPARDTAHSWRGFLFEGLLERGER